MPSLTAMPKRARGRGPVMPKEPWQTAHLHIPADVAMGYWMESSLDVHWDPNVCLAVVPPSKILKRLWKMKARDVMKQIILCAHARAATPEEVRAGLAATGLSERAPERCTRSAPPLNVSEHCPNYHSFFLTNPKT